MKKLFSMLVASILTFWPFTSNAQDEAKFKHHLILEGLSVLNDRERDILTSRRLLDDPLTLEELSAKYDISRERIRQIETKAFEKLSEKIKELSKVVA